MFNHSSTIRELQQTCSPPPFFFFFWPCSPGVLLLNAVLTVRAHQANSHKDRGWEAFTDVVVQWLSKNLEGLIFMLWGSYAQKKGAAIDRVSCFDSGSFSLSFIMCFHTKFSLCVFIETSPRLAGCSSVSPVCSSGVFWVQTLLKGQRAATKIWKVSHWLESTLNSSFLACVQLQTKTPISFPATCFCIFLVLAAFSV